jgi:2-phospho-L-lactate guanylyltransferase
MRVVAVPVKAPARSKTRLSGVLSESERAALTVALMHDVLDACLSQRGWEVWVVASDPPVLGEAAARGARPIKETGRTLLGAVRQVEAELAGSGEELAVVLGDLPWLTGQELRTALAAPGPVVAAPAASDGGTNVLVRRPPSVIPARFGRASFARHRWEAGRAGVDLIPVRAPGLEHDLDRPADLARLVASGRRGRALTVCLDMGLPERLLERAART